MRKRFSQAGVSLIEVIVAVGIITVMVVAIGFAIMSYIDARAALLTNTKTIYLAEEGYEMLRMLRDEDWNTIDALTIDTIYYFDVSTTTISITATPEVIDTDFTRWFIVRDLYRDGDDDIVPSTASGASVDDDGREVEIFVASPNGTSSLQAVLTNVFAI